MLKVIKKVFGGDGNERELLKLEPIVGEVNGFYETLQGLSDEELRAKTDTFREKFHAAVEPIEEQRTEVQALLERSGELAEEVGGDGQAVETERLSVRQRQDLYQQLDDLENDWLDATEDVLDDMMAEAFAVIKETCRRHLGKTWIAGGGEIEWQMVPYDVQLIGGTVLHRGSAAEMRTGEGKTLAAVGPIYLNALVGLGVHVVTVNPYLAQRDAEWMGPIFEFHGLTVDCIDKHDSHSPGRRVAYRADVTYGTNNEFGFDYLRDNSFVVDPEQLVQRGHHFAIVDEVDSVLIDEARTPLIISGPVPQSDEDRFMELQPHVDKLVFAQQKIVARYVSDADRLLKERDAAQEAGESKRAKELEEEAGLALLKFSANPSSSTCKTMVSGCPRWMSRSTSPLRRSSTNWS